jgi:hypothetical protein
VANLFNKLLWLSVVPSGVALNSHDLFSEVVNELIEAVSASLLSRNDVTLLHLDGVQISV